MKVGTANFMAKHYHTDMEMVRLLEKYSKPAFVPVVLIKPKPMTYEDVLKSVRLLSENAVNRIYAR